MFVQFPLLLSGWGRQAFTHFVPILKNILHIHFFSQSEHQFHKLYAPPLILPACVLSTKWKFSFPNSEWAPFNRISLAVCKCLETFSFSCFQFQARRGKKKLKSKEFGFWPIKATQFLQFQVQNIILEKMSNLNIWKDIRGIVSVLSVTNKKLGPSCTTEDTAKGRWFHRVLKLVSLLTLFYIIFWRNTYG